MQALNTFASSSYVTPLVPASIESSVSAPSSLLNLQDSSKIKENEFFQSIVFGLMQAGLDSYESVVCINFCLRLFSFANTDAEEVIVQEFIESSEFQQSCDFQYYNTEKFELLMIDCLIKLVEKFEKKKFSDSVEVARELGRAFFKRINIVFHGTNLGNLNKIRSEGLKRVNTHVNEDEIREINAIGCRILQIPEWARHLHWMGSYFGGFTHDKADTKQGRAIYVAGDAGHALSYATRSPEWYSLFLCRFFDHKSADEKKSFYERVKARLTDLKNPDSEAVKSGKQLVLSNEEASKVQSFIEKYRGIFHHSACLVLKIDFPHISSKYSDSPDLLDDAYDHASIRKILKDALTQRDSWYINVGIDSTDIAPELITSFVLPFEYLKFYK